MSSPQPLFDEAERTDPDLEAHAPTPTLAPRPWLPPAGPTLALIAYCGAVGAYYLHWAASPEVQAERALLAGERLIGDAAGRGVPQAQLLEAAERYLDALSHDPDLVLAHSRMESIRWRFAEAREKIPGNVERRYEVISLRSTLGEAELLAELPVTPEGRFGLSARGEALAQWIGWAGWGFVLMSLWLATRWGAAVVRGARRRR